MKWKLKEYRRATDPHPYLIILCEQDFGFMRCGHERFADRQTAIRRAKALCAQGYRVDVVKDVAASYSTGEQ